MYIVLQQSEEFSENLKKLDTIQNSLDVALEQKKSSEKEVAHCKKLLTAKGKEVEKFKGILANTVRNVFDNLNC